MQRSFLHERLAAIASPLSQNSAITRARWPCRPMSEGVSGPGRRSRSTPDCASLHPGYDTVKNAREDFMPTHSF